MIADAELHAAGVQLLSDLQRELLILLKLSDPFDIWPGTIFFLLVRGRGFRSDPPQNPVGPGRFSFLTATEFIWQKKSKSVAKILIFKVLRSSWCGGGSAECSVNFLLWHGVTGQKHDGTTWHGGKKHNMRGNSKRGLEQKPAFEFKRQTCSTESWGLEPSVLIKLYPVLKALGGVKPYNPRPHRGYAYWDV